MTTRESEEWKEKGKKLVIGSVSLSTEGGGLDINDSKLLRDLKRTKNLDKIWTKVFLMKGKAQPLKKTVKNGSTFIKL